MNLRKDLQCKICHKIYKNPIHLPCMCSSVCLEHIDELKILSNKKRKPRSLKCVKCGIKYGLNALESFLKNPNLELQNLIENYSYLNADEIVLKMDTEKCLLELEQLLTCISEEIFQFSVTLYDHFLNIRHDIDIKREILIDQAFKTVNSETRRNLILDNLNLNSKQMLVKCERLEAGFRENFNRIKPNFIETNFDPKNERKSFLDVFLRDPNLDSSSMEECKHKYERHIDETRARLENFTLFHYDLNRNKFCTDLTNNLDYSLGELVLFEDFINPLEEKIHNLLTSSFERDHTSVSIWNLNTNSIVKCLNGHVSGILCLALYEKDKLITGSRHPDNTIKLWNLTHGNCLQTLYGHTQSVCSLKLLSKTNLLISGSSDSTIKMWCLLNFTCILTLNGHSDTVTCLDEFENEFIVSGSRPV
jgi:WD40 repeat protein